MAQNPPAPHPVTATQGIASVHCLCTGLRVAGKWLAGQQAVLESPVICTLCIGPLSSEELRALHTLQSASTEESSKVLGFMFPVSQVGECVLQRVEQL